MKKGFSRALLATSSLLLCAACVSVQSATDSPVGSYEFSSGASPRDVHISVNVSRENDSYVLGFQGAHFDAHGAAPDGGGTGHIGPDGVLRFSYEDAFG